MNEPITEQWKGLCYGRCLSLTQNTRDPILDIVCFRCDDLCDPVEVVSFYIIRPAQAEALFGQLSGSPPVFIAATWGPAIPVFVLILAIGGMSGFKRHLNRLLLWRCSSAWVAFVILGVPLF